MSYPLFIEKFEKNPFSKDTFVFWKDKNSTYQGGDDKIDKIAGSKILGKLDINMPWAASADLITAADVRAYNGETVHVLEVIKSFNKLYIPLLTLKKPLRNKQGEIFGMMGQSTELKYSEFIEVANLLQLPIETATDRFHYYIQDFKKGLLTEREAECMFYLLQGKSTKQIAKLLQISFRTVEIYLEKIKNKFNVSSKPDLFDIALKNGLTSIIPKSLFNLNLAKKLEF